MSLTYMPKCGASHFKHHSGLAFNCLPLNMAILKMRLRRANDKEISHHKQSQKLGTIPELAITYSKVMSCQKDGGHGQELWR